MARSKSSESEAFREFYDRVLNACKLIDGEKGIRIGLTSSGEWVMELVDGDDEELMHVTAEGLEECFSALIDKSWENGEEGMTKMKMARVLMKKRRILMEVTGAFASRRVACLGACREGLVRALVARRSLRRSSSSKSARYS